MEQREAVHQVKVVGEMTVSSTYQVMLALEGWLNDKVGDLVKSKMMGEQKLYKLMNLNDDPLQSINLSAKVNLEKVREVLGEQGLPFAFNEASDGTTLLFRVKDQELATNALKALETFMVKKPEDIVKKDTFEDKIQTAKMSEIEQHKPNLELSEKKVMK